MDRACQTPTRAWLGVDESATGGKEGATITKIMGVIDFGIETISTRRQELVEVYGRSGFILQQQDAFIPVKRDLTLHVTDMDTVSPLTGAGLKDFYFYDDNIYHRGVVTGISSEKLNHKGDYMVTVNLLLQPGKWFRAFEQKIEGANGAIENTGTCDALVTFAITPNKNDFSLTVNDKTMTFHQETITPITVDMAHMEITDAEGKKRNSDFVRGTFPIALQAGANGIHTEGISALTVSGNWGKLL